MPHVSPSEIAEQGRFREDLFFRLAANHLQIAPLRERPADALMLFAVALRRAGVESVVASEDVLERVWHHPWPGNGREVVHVAARTATSLMGDDQLKTLPALQEATEIGHAAPTIAGPGVSVGPRRRARMPTREALAAQMDACQGNVTAVAKFFDVRRQQIYRWCERLDIEIPGRGS